jgi:HD-GYP domain-containing protein (c-di-GMP phosphodiesterase class II)
VPTHHGAFTPSAGGLKRQRPYDSVMTDSGVGLSDLMVSLSLATDLGFGQPSEHMLRSARIAMRLGDRLGLDSKDLATLYDVSILTYVGCPVYGNEAALLFGDDIDFRAHAIEIDLTGFPAMVFMLRRSGQGTSAFNRARQAALLMASGGRQVAQQMAAHCSASGALAARLGFDDDVQAGVEQAYARWDGRGFPEDLSGTGVSLAARISHVAEACEVFQRSAGIETALDVVRSRSGTHFDPDIAQLVTVDPEALFNDLDRDTVEEILAVDPAHRGPLTDDELDRALEAIGDFCDLRCTFFAGHARATAELVRGAHELMKTPAAEARLAYHAALVHDVGRFGVPATLWGKAGPLTASERERARLHVYYVERIFNRPEPLRRIGLLAATHHERMDGSGYHRGVGGAMLSSQARVLAAADAYSAMAQPRPYRAAMSEAHAARELQADAANGRLDPLATDAVLAAAGHRVTRTRAGGPTALTPRESEVLVLLTQGMPNKSIARSLDISPKTVSNHIEHVYAKLGVANRAGAAMYAMQYGLVGAVPDEAEMKPASCT